MNADHVTKAAPNDLSIMLCDLKSQNKNINTVIWSKNLTAVTQVMDQDQTIPFHVMSPVYWNTCLQVSSLQTISVH